MIFDVACDTSLVLCSPGHSSVSPSALEVGSGEWAVPLPRKFFEFLYQNGEFWCILGSN